jgi:hypothetical protein
VTVKVHAGLSGSQAAEAGVDAIPTRENRVKRGGFDEVLYADDTICVSQDSRAMNALLKRIEEEGEKYGMKLNHIICELMTFVQVGNIYMRDGTIIKPVHEARYLGCQLNDRAGGLKEVKQRIGEGMIMMQRLDLFWEKNNCSIKKNLNVQKAVIDTKLTYGLESLQLPPTATRMLDTVQLQGFRKILGMKTTYVNRASMNEEVYRRVKAALGDRDVIKLSENHMRDKVKFLAGIIAAGQGDPRYDVVFGNGMMLHDHGRKRVGRPRQN